MATGITKRHGRGCGGRNGGRCNCEPTYEAWVFSKRENRKIRKSFAREAEAKTWRADALALQARGGLRAPKRTTLDQAWLAWKAAAEAGTVRNRSGDRFKPAAIRGYDQGMRLRVLPEFGSVRLADLDRVDLQRFVYRLQEQGLAPPTIDVTLNGVRAIYRHAIEQGEIAFNPTLRLKLPRSDVRRDRVADPVEGAALLAALPVEDRPLWATFMYGGLRRGEVRALRACDVDLARGTISVEFNWDDVEGQVGLKTRTGRRRVPVPAVLRDALVDHRLRVPREGEQLVFGRTASDPFRPEALQARADRAWTAASLKRITPHECRHTYASLMIAAGVNHKALSTFMGHANIKITLDLYGHLFDGAEDEAAGLLDAYLAAQLDAAEDAARSAGAELTGAHTGAQVARRPTESHEQAV